jgi:hypothetical protein
VCFDEILIAPCGINCGTCYAFFRNTNKCPGCLSPSQKKPKTRLQCKIKNCEQLAESNSKYCFHCNSFPCRRLVQMDKRYRKKYRVSLIQNQELLKKLGMPEFLSLEARRWVCPNCGSGTSVHLYNCQICNFALDKP